MTGNTDLFEATASTDLNGNPNSDESLPESSSSCYPGNISEDTTESGLPVQIPSPFETPASASTAFVPKPVASDVCDESASKVSRPTIGSLSETTTQKTESGLFEQILSIFSTPAPESTAALPRHYIQAGRKQKKKKKPFTITISCKDIPSKITNSNVKKDIRIPIKPGIESIHPTGTPIKFEAPTGFDTMRRCVHPVKTKLQCITIMDAYKNKSCEELRMEDYAANRKGATSAFRTVGTTEDTAPQTGNKFGTIASPVFGTVNNTGGTTLQTGTDPKTLKKTTNFVDASTQTQSEFYSETLSHNLSKLMLNSNCSDLTIEVKGEEFHLHQNILLARMPVFLSKFKLEITEKETHRVSIDDCEKATFRAFVQYIYTGRTDHLCADIVCELYTLADKYQVHELKLACLEFIKSMLSVDTFCSVVQFALTYDDRELLELATDFLSNNTLEVMKSVKYMKWFLSDNPIKANELLVKALEKKQR